MKVIRRKSDGFVLPYFNDVIAARPDMEVIEAETPVAKEPPKAKAKVRVKKDEDLTDELGSLGL